MKKFSFLFLIAVIVASCKNNNGSSASSSVSDSTMSAVSPADSMTQKNKAVIIADFQALNDGNIDAAFNGTAPDAVDYGDGTMPPVKSLDSMKAGMKMFMGAFPDDKNSIFLVMADSNHVAVFANWTGTFKNSFMGIKATNKSYKISDVDIFTFNDAGQIISHRNITTNQAIFDQVGAKMKK
jgi:predicted ester cyclase